MRLLFKVLECEINTISKYQSYTDSEHQVKIFIARSFEIYITKKTHFISYQYCKENYNDSATGPRYYGTVSVFLYYREIIDA